MLCMKLRVNPEVSSHGKKFFSFSFILHWYEMMNIYQSYYINYFMVYVSQTIMLHTLNVCNALCQLYLNKTDRKKQFFKKTTYHQNSIKDKRDHLNSPINIKKKKIDSIVQNSGKRNSQAQMASLENFTKNLKN